MKQKKNQSSYIVLPLGQKQIKENPVILRIILSSVYTRIDFGYAAPWIYIKGGWIKIAAHTFIEVLGNKERYKLQNAINIPISPKRHNFESEEDWRVFSLYFEPIPIMDCTLNIIEKEKPNIHDFNYYNIELKDVTNVEIIDFEK